MVKMKIRVFLNQTLWSQVEKFLLSWSGSVIEMRRVCSLHKTSKKYVIYVDFSYGIMWAEQYQN
jgi:hypothetical protein